MVYPLAIGGTLQLPSSQKDSTVFLERNGCVIESLVALVALTAMEIVLGIDNIVFIAILTSRLPVTQQAKARRIGLALAMGTRILLLLTLSWVLKLTAGLIDLSSFDETLKTVVTNEEARHEMLVISARDLIMLVGGLFLVAKSTLEIHHKIEGHKSESAEARKPSFSSVIVQIAILDIVFSLDSVITAVGMAQEIWVMVAAVVMAVGVMLVFAGSVSAFVERHPTVKMLALSFLILIGVMLIAEGIGTHIEKGYIYFAMAFSLGVEFLNIVARGRGAGR